MSNQILKHKGFSGSVEFSADDDLLVGKVLDIESLIMYSGASVEDIRAAFISAVDDYIASCERNKTTPEKAYTGSFNVRIGGDLHRTAAMVARNRGQRLNELIKRAVAAEVVREVPPAGSGAISLSTTRFALADLSWDIQESETDEPGLGREIGSLVTTYSSVRTPARSRTN